MPQRRKNRVARSRHEIRGMRFQKKKKKKKLISLSLSLPPHPLPSQPSNAIAPSASPALGVSSADEFTKDIVELENR